jgi:hypothetical protein
LPGNLKYGTHTCTHSFLFFCAPLCVLQGVSLPSTSFSAAAIQLLGAARIKREMTALTAREKRKMHPKQQQHTCYTEDFLPSCQAFNFSEHEAKCESLVPTACAADRVIKRSVEPERKSVWPGSNFIPRRLTHRGRTVPTNWTVRKSVGVNKNFRNTDFYI